MKILCIVDKYFPYESANTLCAEKIVTHFRKSGAVIDYYVIKQNSKEKKHQLSDGGEIYYGTSFFVELSCIVRKKLNVSSYSDAPSSYIKRLNVLGKILNIGKIRTSNWIIDNMSHKSGIKYFVKKHKTHPYDYIFSFSAPFALSMVASKMQKKMEGVKWIAFFMDSFIYNQVLDNSNKQIEKRKVWLNSVLNNVFKVFAIKGIIDFNIKKGFTPKYLNKCIEIHQPNLVNKKINVVKNEHSIINCVYAGRFYEDIRNPELMFQIFEKLEKNINLKIAGGGCLDIIEKYKQLMNNRLVYLGKLTQDETSKLQQESDVLINLGNTVTNQIPSKVLDYISTCKPIINFYFNEQDTSLFYLKKCAYCLNINLSKQDKNTIELINKFCQESINKDISFEENTKLLKECTAEEVYKTIERNIK